MDLLSTVPFLISFLFLPFDSVYYEVSEYLMVFKIFRVPFIMRCLSEAMEKMKVRDTLTDVLIYTILSVTLIHWSSCIQLQPKLVSIDFMSDTWQSFGEWFADTTDPDHLSAIKYVVALFRAVSALSNNANRMFVPTTTSDRIFIATLVIIGRMFLILVMAKMLEKMHAVSSSQTKYEVSHLFLLNCVNFSASTSSQEIKNQLDEYIKHNFIPERTKKKVRTYYRYYFKTAFFLEKEILNLITSQLSSDLMRIKAKKTLENVYLFRSLPKSVALTVASMLTYELVLKDEILFEYGDVAKWLYIVTSGSLALYTNTQREIAHIKDGDFTGEIGMLTDEHVRTSTCVSLEICELQMLALDQFRILLDNYPDLESALLRLAEDRLQMIIYTDLKLRRRILQRLEPNNKKASTWEKVTV